MKQTAQIVSKCQVSPVQDHQRGLRAMGSDGPFLQAPTPVQSTEDWINRIQGELEALEKNIESMEGKVMTCLRPADTEPSKDFGGEPLKTISASPINERLRSIQLRIESAARWIEAIAGRVEL
jgi:hypothetical protein